jgi:hypothetical protein
MTTPAPYTEDPAHVPDPTALSGTMETTSTGGGRHDHLAGVTRVFHHAEQVAHHLADEIAARALHRSAPEAETVVPEAPQAPQEAVQEPVEPVVVPVAAQDAPKPQNATKTPSAGK